MARIGHASLKHSGDPNEVAGYLARLIRVYGLVLLTTTESNGAYRRALRRALPRKQWSIVRRGEYLVVWRRDVFAARRRGTTKTRSTGSRLIAAVLVRMTRTKGEADWRNLFVASVQLVHRGERRVWRVRVGHLASGVESGDHYRTDRPAKVATHQTGVHRWGEQNRAIRRKHPNQILLAHADTNVDHHRAAWRAAMVRGLGLASVWTTKRKPFAGTHPHRSPERLIDAGYTNARVIGAGRCHEVEPPPWVDHWAFWYETKDGD